MVAPALMPPAYEPATRGFDHLAAWFPRLANWGRVNSGPLRSLDYVLPCYAHREELDEADTPRDELDAERVEGLIGELRAGGGWEPHYCAVRGYFLGPPRTWEQVAQILQREHRSKFASACQLHELRADAARYLADRFCARLDVLERAL